VIEGRVKLTIKDTSFTETPLVSPLLENPTWSTILNTVNEMLKDCTPSIGFLQDIIPYDAGVYEIAFS
jgi:hypothetical protein